MYIHIHIHICIISFIYIIVYRERDMHLKVLYTSNQRVGVKRTALTTR